MLLSRDMAIKPQLSVNIEPRLLALRISADDIAAMRVTNPARALGR